MISGISLRCLVCQVSVTNFCRASHSAQFHLQASNLIRALRQSREAAALGLLEGQSQRSEGQQDIEVNVNKVAVLWWLQTPGLH